MKQLLLNPDGRMVLESVPDPVLLNKGVIIQTSYSAISPGTELSSIRNAEENIFVKMYRRKRLLKSISKRLNPSYIIKVLKNKGLPEIVSRIPEPIGYSCSGIVIETNCDIPVGARVACMGSGHAEKAFVPYNLCQIVPDNVEMQHAAYGALGAIATQGFRRAQITPGDKVAVIGMGILGQMTIQMLKASACECIAIDLDDNRLTLINQNDVQHTINASMMDPVIEVKHYTEGRGVDAVIICAASSSPLPMQQSLEMCREKGRVVIVGDVRLEMPREHLYHKELDVFIARSYGPGRYDPEFEFEGKKFPKATVRWSENENLKYYLELLSQGKLNLSHFLSEDYQFDNALEAYNMLRNNAGKKLAMVLNYGSQKEKPLKRIVMNNDHSDKIKVGLIGCGAFAQNQHLPNLFKNSRYQIHSLADVNSIVVNEMAKRYHANSCTTNHTQLLQNPDVQALFITTRHNLHAPLIIEALHNGKHVFVEKPIAMSLNECQQIKELKKKYPDTLISVGFNRRFSEHIHKSKQLLDQIKRPKMIRYRIAATPIPKSHWVCDPVEGGGRIIGEAVHFIDLLYYLMGEEPVEVMAHASQWENSEGLYSNENYTITIRFADGSIGHIFNTDLSTKDFPKEHIEIFAGDHIFTIHNFESSTMNHYGKEKTFKLADKGFFKELDNFALAIENKSSPLVTEVDGLRATICALAAIKSIGTNQPVKINHSDYIN